MINTDDLQGLALAERLAAASTLDVWSCSCSSSAARLQAGRIRHHAKGLSFDVLEGSKRAEVETALVGQFNVANVLGVIGVLRASGVALSDAAAACAALTPVPGRMQLVGDGESGPQVVVDYAHTPDALDKCSRHCARSRRREAANCGAFRARRQPRRGEASADGRAGLPARRSRRRHHDNPRLEPPDFIISQILPA